MMLNHPRFKLKEYWIRHDGRFPFATRYINYSYMEDVLRTNQCLKILNVKIGLGVRGE